MGGDGVVPSPLLLLSFSVFVRGSHTVSVKQSRTSPILRVEPESQS